MASATLQQIEALVDSLEPAEQASLLEYLTPRVTRQVSRSPDATLAASPVQPEALKEDPWDRFFRIGAEISRDFPLDGRSATQMVCDDRR